MTKPTIHVLHLGTLSDAGGVSSVAVLDYIRRFEVSRMAAAIKHSLAVVRRRRQSDDWQQTARRLGVECHDLVRYAKCDISLIWRLARLARRSAVDVVHAHDTNSRWLALVLQPLVGFRIVATAAGWSGASWKDRLSAGVDRKLLPGFDRIIAANNVLARDLCRLGCRPQQIDVIHGGVDTERFSRRQVAGYIRGELGLSADDRVVGIHAERAGVDELQRFVQAIRFAQGEIGPLHVVVFGPGAVTRALPHGLADEGLEGRVYMMGPREDLPEIYAALDVLLLPPSASATPLLEAQSMEVPIVACGGLGIGELIEHGTTGILVESDELSAIGAAVANMLTDDRRCASLAAAGRLRICQRFRADDLLHQVAGTYHRAWAQA